MRFSAFILCVVISISTVSAQKRAVELADSTKSTIDELVASAAKKHGLVGVSYAIVHKHSTLHKGAHGFAKRSAKQKATTETNYVVGSVSKLFTQMAIMRLVEQGKVDLDADITTYIPEFSMKTRFDSKQDFSIRNLLTHHSGMTADYLKGLISEKPMTKEALIKALKGEYQPLPSNHIHNYSNVAYTLLGAVIERTSGKTYNDFMDQEVLGPLGMNRSHFDFTNPKVSGQLSMGYKGKQERLPYAMRAVPAGGLTTNVEDLTRFMQMYLNKGIIQRTEFLKQSSIDEAWTKQNQDIALDFSYDMALSWRLSNNDQEKVLKSVPVRWHTGGTVLFASMVLLCPEQEFGVIVLENTAGEGITTAELANDIAKTVLHDYYGINEPESIPLRKKKGNSDEMLEQMPGDYSTAYGWAHITRRGKRLHATLLGRKFKLIPHEGDIYGLKFRLLSMIPINIGALKPLTFTTTELNKEKLLVLKQGNETHFFAKEFTPKASSSAWKDRIGKYEVKDLGDDDKVIHRTALVEKHGVLYFQFQPKLYQNLTLNMPLEIINDREAIVIGYGRWQGETLRFNGDELHYMGYDWVKK